jgi:predicted PurR-regulated permease PerM
MVFSFSNILAWLMTLSNFAFNVFLYFTIVIYFLNDGNDLVE